MSTLGVLVPTRRPGNAARLAAAVAATASASTTLIFAVDDDDPARAAYGDALTAGRRVRLRFAPASVPHHFGPVLNWAATAPRPGGVPAFAEFTHLGALSDDHLPRTPGWDGLLIAALGGQPGVAYGDDQFQSAKVPTAAVISAKIVAALGYMTAPVLMHCFTDVFWHELGRATRLEYLPDVIIEHLHPSMKKAPVDAVYEAGGMNEALADADRLRWQAWLRETWPGELARLTAALEEAA